MSNLTCNDWVNTCITASIKYENHMSYYWIILLNRLNSKKLVYNLRICGNKVSYHYGCWSLKKSTCTEMKKTQILWIRTFFSSPEKVKYPINFLFLNYHQLSVFHHNTYEKILEKFSHKSWQSWMKPPCFNENMYINNVFSLDLTIFPDIMVDSHVIMF